MLIVSVAMVLFMCLFSNPRSTGYNYVKFIALSGRSLGLCVYVYVVVGDEPVAALHYYM